MFTSRSSKFVFDQPPIFKIASVLFYLLINWILFIQYIEITWKSNSAFSVAAFLKCLGSDWSNRRCRLNDNQKTAILKPSLAGRVMVPHTGLKFLELLKRKVALLTGKVYLYFVEPFDCFETTSIWKLHWEKKMVVFFSYRQKSEGWKTIPTQNRQSENCNWHECFSRSKFAA